MSLSVVVSSSPVSGGVSVPAPIRHYESGEPYLPAQGRRAASADRLAAAPVIDILREQPDWGELWRRLERELRIRYYQPHSIKNYRTALRGLAVWFRRPPHELDSEHVRDYLFRLVSRGASATWVSVNVSTFRTCLDKLGGLSVSRALVTPRRGRPLPQVLSENEVRQVLCAAPTLRDKLLLGFLYACGLRVSECCSLRWGHLDVELKAVRVVSGKGRKDRVVQLPECFVALVQQGRTRCGPEEFVFPGERPGRHLSPRAAELVMARAVRISGIGKPATPHTLRHSYATHLLEHGTDARFIQELLGHARLETTRIYLHVARPQKLAILNPLDRIARSLHPTEAEAVPDSPGRLGAGAQSGTRPIEIDRQPSPLGGRRPPVEVSSQLASPGPATSSIPGTRPGPSGHFSGRRLSVSLGALEEHDGVPTCTLAIHLRTPYATINLLGAHVLEPRTGWVALDLPLLDLWEPELRQLSAADRQRVESAGFYELLRAHVGPRFLALRSARASKGAQPKKR